MVLSIILGIIGLGIVIFVHETGHFLAAKLSGITVEAFSIGWGKVLFRWKRRETEYRISLLPIGGYCKMKGGDLVQKAWEEKKETIPQEEGSFYTASPLKRIFVSFSGPGFNLVFAFLVFSLIWGIGFTTQSYSNRIVLVSDYGEPGAVYPVDRGGFRTGDKIIEIDGTPIRNYSEIKEAVAISPGEELSVLVERNGLEKRLTLIPEKNPDTGIGMIGIYA